MRYKKHEHRTPQRVLDVTELCDCWMTYTEVAAEIQARWPLARYMHIRRAIDRLYQDGLLLKRPHPNGHYHGPRVQVRFRR